jgi:hypothetical protein
LKDKGNGVEPAAIASGIYFARACNVRPASKHYLCLPQSQNQEGNKHFWLFSRVFFFVSLWLLFSLSSFFPLCSSSKFEQYIKKWQSITLTWYFAGNNPASHLVDYVKSTMAFV